MTLLQSLIGRMLRREPVSLGLAIGAFAEALPVLAAPSYVSEPTETAFEKGGESQRRTTEPARRCLGCGEVDSHAPHCVEPAARRNRYGGKVPTVEDAEVVS